MSKTFKQILRHNFVGSSFSFGDKFSPLVSKELKLMLSLSAKSGSIFGASWFFYQTGVWDDVKNYGQWPHKYRFNIFYKSPEYRKALVDFQNTPEEYFKVKLVRDPFERLVSSYIHVLKHPSILEKDLGRKFSEPGLSFRQFVDLVELLGTEKCDPHYSTQTYHFERKLQLKYDHLIRLESSMENMVSLEKKLGLSHSPLKEFRSSKHHSKRDSKNKLYIGDAQHNFGRSTYSPYINFYSKDLIEKAIDLYREDFENYGYPMEIAISESSL